MRPTKWLLLLTSLFAGGAEAGSDKLANGPAPDWVKPVALPPKPDKPDEAPLRILLADQQSRLEAGKVSNYVDIAMQVQTPQGLAAGNVSIPWNPETDELTVHKLLIHRDGKAIDVLAGGQTFTVVRREPNLENAMLDGVLTANIQPEGLQVGDIIEYAMTITTSDPVLKGHVEQAGGGWNLLPFARTHLNVQWPSTLPVKIRQSGALPPVKPVKVGAVSRVELSMDDVQPVLAPVGAPARYSTGRIIEFSDFKNWAEVGALMAPLYDVAARVPAEGPLRTELEKIKAASTDPVKRTEAALALVQDRVRYVALLMGAGGLTPAKAEETWGRRYGDCKAKTALLLALLHELGVDAEPVAANALSGDGIDQRLPMIGLFNHVLVRAHIGGKTYWLDGTRVGDTSLARLRIPDFGWGLPLVAQNATLVRMLPEPLTQPDDDFAVDFDLRSGVSLPATVKATVTLRGDDALGMRLALASLAADARDKALRDYFKRRLDDLEIAKVSASYDVATGSELLSMEGKAKMDWSDGQYWTDATWVGYEADFSRTTGTDLEAPFAVGYPSFERTVETIQLPPGFSEQNIWRKDPIDETVGGLEYRRSASLKDNVFRIERTVRAVVPELPAKDAPAAQKRLKEMSNLAVALRKPGNYRMTSAELDVIKSQPLATAQDYINRGQTFIENGRVADAKRDFDAAINLDPKSVLAFADRAMVNEKLGDLEAAKRDIDAAAKIDPENIIVWHARGTLAMSRKAYPEALAAFSHAIKNNPKDGWALGNRSWTYRQLKDYAAERADLKALLQLEPYGENPRANLISSYGFTGEFEAGVQEASTIDLATVKGTYLANTIAAAWLQHGDPDKALKAFDRSLELDPAQVAVLSSRARTHSTMGHYDAALVDTAAALAIEPKNADLYLARANLFSMMGQKDKVLEEAKAVSAANPTDGYAHIIAGRIYGSLGKTDEAMKAFSAALDAPPGNSASFNRALILINRAESRPSSDVAGKLADYAAALKLDPTQNDARYAYADLLRRSGRLDEAAAQAQARIDADPTNEQSYADAADIYGLLGKRDDMMKAFDRALAIKPSVGLYLRRIASREWNDFVGKDADIAAALKLEPENQMILLWRGDLELFEGKFAAATKTYADLLARKPGDYSMLNVRGIAYAMAGDTAKADADFRLARDKATTSSSLNALCYDKAKRNVALDRALEECEAALKKSPDSAAILDSKAFVLLRMNRLDEALVSFDRALAKSPDIAASLFGRAIIWSRKGDKAKAAVDRDEALRLDPFVRTKYESYGVTM